MNKTHHYILYAKGHYIKGYSTLEDITRIWHAAFPKGVVTMDILIKDLCHIALTAIKEATISQLHPKGEKSDHGLKSVNHINQSISPLTEYTEQWLFLLKSMPGIMKKHGPSVLTFEDEVDLKYTDVYTEGILQSLLTTIARWNTDLAITLEEPDSHILPLTDPERKKKKEKIHDK